MFDQTFVNSRAATRKPWMVGLSLTLQFVATGAVMVWPLLHVPPLPARVEMPVWVRLERPPEPVPTRVAEALHRSSAPRRMVAFDFRRAPVSVPERLDMTPDAPPQISALPQLNAAAALLGPALVFGEVARPPEVKAVVTAPVQPTAPVRIHGSVQAASLVSAPKPAYPPGAKAARIQGTVKLQAVISQDGTIRNLTLVSGPPLLVAAAMQAVQQWRYRPTLLNGQPVEVITDIDVNFRLN